MEMGRRDMKRGGNKKQSGSGFSAKSKKGLLKELNSSRLKDYYEFSSSDLENEVSRKKKKKKLKVIKKNFKDSNGVVHASVPRKLRSAMKKRNLESVSKLSSASKRLNRSKTGTESCLIKMENQEMEGEGIAHELISKDEKEVAETLYGLAGMFTETDSIDKKTCDDHLSNEKETSKVDSSLIVEADFTKTESVLFSDEMTSDKQRSSTGMVYFIDRLKQSSFVNATDSSSARAMETKVATSDADYKCNGLALWPGLSSGPQVLAKPSLSIKLPPWMNQAVSPPSKNASVSSEPLRIQPRNLKKCASHIYISHLIKALQNSKSTSPATLNQTEQRPSEMSERVLPDPVITITDFKSLVSPPPKRYQNPHLHDINRTHNQKPAQEEDMSKLALELYGPNTSQKQSYDFLSLSSTGASSQSHFQIQNSFPQYPISAAFNTHLSPSTSALSSHQVQQISPYLPSRYQTAYNANQQQQQQLQKRLWAASQYRQTNGNTTQSSNQYSILQVGGSSQRYNNNVTTQQQQQHRLMAAMSHYHNNNPSRIAMNRQEHRFPLIYEDTRTPLQLLCNEQT